MERTESQVKKEEEWSKVALADFHIRQRKRRQEGISDTMSYHMTRHPAENCRERGEMSDCIPFGTRSGKMIRSGL